MRQVFGELDLSLVIVLFLVWLVFVEIYYDLMLKKWIDPRYHLILSF